MIGAWSGGAAEFLVAVAIGTLLLLGLPLLLVPLAWARLLRWTLPQETHLAIYFGRCLGAVACVLAVFALLASRAPALQPFFFQLMLANFALMIGVHAYGAWRGIQPLSETLEILAWAALLLLGLLFYPAGS